MMITAQMTISGSNAIAATYKNVCVVAGVGGMLMVPLP